MFFRVLFIFIRIYNSIKSPFLYKEIHIHGLSLIAARPLRLSNTVCSHESSDGGEEDEEDVCSDRIAGAVVYLVLPDTVLLAVWCPVLLHPDHLLRPAQLVVGPAGVRPEVVRAELVDPQGGRLEAFCAGACKRGCPESCQTDFSVIDCQCLHLEVRPANYLCKCPHCPRCQTSVCWSGSR